MKLNNFRKKKIKIRNAEVVYREENTECDVCEHLDYCKENVGLIEVTNFADERPHYMKGIGTTCKKDDDFCLKAFGKPFEEMTLEDIENYKKRGV